MRSTEHQLLIVLANATPGQDAEFNDWYDKVHLPEVLAVPGIVSARRYRLASQQMRGVRERPYEYVAIYEIDAEDAKAVADEITARALAGTIIVSPTLDVGRTLLLLLQPIGGESSR